MLCCIGGVCVPYTAVVPIVVLALKWLATKLARMGLLPKSVADLLQVDVSACKDCPSSKEVEPISATGPSRVTFLKNEDDFNKALEDTTQKVVCKFTASWCKPCHKIQPFYEKLSAQYSKGTTFWTIDVDDFDAVASKYKVAMMPTFVVVQGDQVLGKYSGSNEPELQQFLKAQLAPSS